MHANEVGDIKHTANQRKHVTIPDDLARHRHGIEPRLAVAGGRHLLDCDEVEAKPAAQVQLLEGFADEALRRLELDDAKAFRQLEVIGDACDQQPLNRPARRFFLGVEDFIRADSF